MKKEEEQNTRSINKKASKQPSCSNKESGRGKVCGKEGGEFNGNVKKGKGKAEGSKAE